MNTLAEPNAHIGGGYTVLYCYDIAIGTYTQLLQAILGIEPLFHTADFRFPVTVVDICPRTLFQRLLLFGSVVRPSLTVLIAAWRAVLAFAFLIRAPRQPHLPHNVPHSPQFSNPPVY